jgi:hypothetical protein
MGMPNVIVKRAIDVGVGRNQFLANHTREDPGT